MITETINTGTLLEQQAAYEKQKSTHIAALIKERTDITVAHEARQGQIASDLKALGWKPERKKREKK